MPVQNAEIATMFDEAAGGLLERVLAELDVERADDRDRDERDPGQRLHDRSDHGHMERIICRYIIDG